jgi:methylthioribose-1-phosphate isomerase
MTICNTGGLAAVERGTALGVIQTMFERGLLIEALPTETRPLLQGSRLTTWELETMGAPFRLIVDSAGPFLLARGGIDAVLVGADRIAANGDTANKIGTYSLALGARRAGVPFLVVAPESSIDMDTASGEMIEIEDRGPGEVVQYQRISLAPAGTEVLNPAFDITPHDLITAIVTDRRVVRIDRGEKLNEVAPGPRRGPASATTIHGSSRPEKEKE